MNSLQTRGIQKATTVANNQRTVSVKPWHGVQTTSCNRLRAVTNQLAAREQLSHELMRFIALKFRVRIEERIAIIQTSNVTDVEHAVQHSIDPAAAIRPLVRRKTERVRDAPGGIPVVGQFPKLFYSQTVNLRLSTFVETKTLNQLLC